MKFLKAALIPLIVTAVTAAAVAPVVAGGATLTFDARSLGLVPGSHDASGAMSRLMAAVRQSCGGADSVVIDIAPGRYHFHSTDADTIVGFISNHDQTVTRRAGIVLDSVARLTLEGNGAEFVFHGRMLPLALRNSSGCTLRNFSIDFADPRISQVEIVANEPGRGISFRPSAEVDWTITPDSLFETAGEGWTARPFTGIAFDGPTRHIVYNTGDLAIDLRGVTAAPGGVVTAPRWTDSRLAPGTVVAMRTYERPSPAIFLHHSRNTVLEHVSVHYAEGMGLLAQLCDGVRLEGFGVCRRGEDDPRYFTTQADATHFSGCKGAIVSRNGLYEAMMDDAINVHGTYLELTRRLGPRTVEAAYMHPQTWGFPWGQPGDSISILRRATLESVGPVNFIDSIVPAPTAADSPGPRAFIITLRDTIGPAIADSCATHFGLENLSWTPGVEFSGNTVRNNRARGALFSTPLPVVVEDNLFDHTSGSAILLSGDCNGWFESGACRSVTIRRNRFVNPLTSLYQFTNAAISICPVIPRPDLCRGYFHGGAPGSITIEDNEFVTFDAPLLYALSVDGLTFRRNTLTPTTDFAPFHPNRSPLLLEHTTRASLSPL